MPRLTAADVTAATIFAAADTDFTLTLDREDGVLVALWDQCPEAWGAPGHGATIDEALLRCRYHLLQLVHARDHDE